MQRKDHINIYFFKILVLTVADPKYDSYVEMVLNRRGGVSDTSK